MYDEQLMFKVEVVGSLLLHSFTIVRYFIYFSITMHERREYFSFILCRNQDEIPRCFLFILKPKKGLAKWQGT
jgi:hypothetical protein